ncbi:MAG: DUF2961 domain-containing protein [Bacteroidetes bacterium]|nr:DUF2961 domain-containing protein [Bacteroidota bacterium]MBT3748861.1 DUF2961 domain-containing protein [Bacteroidota bacterium]MBT4408868.1 DUF2961 domain-containing protein [Bacteroidota bacterium]MBT5428261.1 DUF2961 domain-containing protein [Bacteroidota bacterium]MBT7092681.1 DUF2961 domain-containing protein [Bacteroidota bacterium]
MKNVLLSVLCTISFVLCSDLSAQTISTGSLLDEMIDLEILANYPDPAFSSIQYSSYDHRSKYPDYEGWFSNSDGFGGEPIPGFEKVIKEPGADNIGEYLICDVEGPGAIVRLWTARFVGEITMWLDGNSEPVYNGPAQKFFQHTYEAILGEELKDTWKETYAQNTAGYYPIPFSKSLKIVWTGDISKLHFYHVQLRFYESGTKIRTFQSSDIRKYNKKLTEIADVLADPSGKLDGSLAKASHFSVRLMPGEKLPLANFEQEGAITRFAAHVTAVDVDAALKQTLLEVRFDKAPWGQIQSPIGDFFGASPGINPYESLPFTVFHDGRMVCRYTMPFKKHAEVLIHNKGEQEVTVTLKIKVDDYKWLDGTSMHFRARWRADHELLSNPAEVKDIPYLLIRGKGRMVGAAAFLMNPTFVPSSYGNWWGEGDEKIFIDDNLKAAFIGTGSEDYFNYAWSSSAIFTHAYCGQPRNDGPANRGFVTNYRWHIIDNIPFEKSFDFYMELYSHRVVEGFSYARMIYTYASPECHDDHIPVSTEDVRLLEMPENWWPDPDGWAVNAIFYQIEDLLAGHAQLKMKESYLWSAGKLAVWTPGKAGEEIALRIPVTETGNYMIALTIAKEPGSGTIEASLNDEILKLNGKEQSNLSKEYRHVSRNLKSGAIELSEGIHVLKLKSIDGKPVGLDFIWVKKN